MDAQDHAIRAGTGAATGSVEFLRSPISVRKHLRPLTAGRHSAGASDPAHWAYWRRECLAYASGLLPEGPGLTAPRCLAVTGDTIDLEFVAGLPQDPGIAAAHLGAWQATAPIPHVPWLAQHQLAQRIAVTTLDWTDLRVDPAARARWDRRHALLDGLETLPRVLTHGDFHLDNLIARDHDTVVLDWGTFGVSPAGFDLAHLALSALADVTAPYLDAVAGRLDPAAVRLGYEVTLALVATSRLHWMLTNDVEAPAGYTEFTLTQLSLI